MFKKAIFGFLCCAGVFASQDYCDLGPSSRASVGTRQGEGVGYKEGYSSLDVFLTPNWTKSFQPFADARGHIFNNGYYAGNFGVGARYLTKWDWAFGANMYYDFRTVEKLNPSQIGSGLEALSRYVDFRFNGYFPVADTERKGPARIQRVQGNQIIVKRHLAAAYTVINGEVGFPIRGFFDPINLYMALGPYYLFRKEIDQFNFGNAFGGEIRLNMRVLDGLDLGGNFSYDRLFNGRINGYIAFSFPFGPATLRYNQARWKERYPSKYCSDAAWRQRILTQPVARHEIIPIKAKTLKGAGVDPLTGNPLSLVFVNNLAPWLGNGTFTAPFQSLALAQEHSQPDQVVYLMSGDPYYESITLKPGQSLQGSGQPLAVEDTYYPAYTESGPLLVSQDHPAVTLVDSGSVAGISIESENAWGIDARNCHEAIIKQVHFTGGDLGGVIFDGAPPGVKAVEECLFSGFKQKATAISAKNLIGSEVRIRENFIGSMHTGIDYSGPSFFHIRANNLSQLRNAVRGALDHGRSYSIIAYNELSACNVGIHFEALTTGLAQLQVEYNRVHTRDRFNDAMLLTVGGKMQPGKMEAFVAGNSFHGADVVIKTQHEKSDLVLRFENNFSNVNYALINYESKASIFNVDSLNKEEGGVEDLNQAGSVLIPFEPVHFRIYDQGPRFFTPFEGFEEDRK